MHYKKIGKKLYINNINLSELNHVQLKGWCDFLCIKNLIVDTLSVNLHPLIKEIKIFEYQFNYNTWNEFIKKNEHLRGHITFHYPHHSICENEGYEGLKAVIGPKLPFNCKFEPLDEYGEDLDIEKHMPDFIIFNQTYGWSEI